MTPDGDLVPGAEGEGEVGGGLGHVLVQLVAVGKPLSARRDPVVDHVALDQDQRGLVGDLPRVPHRLVAQQHLQVRLAQKSSEFPPGTVGGGAKLVAAIG